MPRLACLVIALSLVVGCGSEAPITDCVESGGIEPICGFSNPEDLVLAPGNNWLIASHYLGVESEEDFGSLHALFLPDGPLVEIFPPRDVRSWRRFAELQARWGSPDCPGPPVRKFSPHGIDTLRNQNRSVALLIVNHGTQERIELFELTPGDHERAPRPVWRGCVPLPEGTSANDVALLPGGGFVVTHMLEPGGALSTYWNLLRGFFGGSTGYVLEWTPEGGWRKIPGSEESFPNGIIASPDGSKIWFAAWQGNRVVGLSRDGTTEPVSVEVSHPDNLTWADDGRILVASHDFSISDVFACSSLEQGTCGAPFSIVAIDPETLETETLLEQEGKPMGAGTVGLQVGTDLYIGSFAGDRIGRARDLFTESASP